MIRLVTAVPVPGYWTVYTVMDVSVPIYNFQLKSS